MDHTLQHRDGVFHVRTSGPAELQAFLDLMDRLTSHPRWGPGSRILLDHRDLDTKPMTFGNVLALADACIAQGELLGSPRIAILVSDDLSYGMNRMWSALVAGRLDYTGGIFRSHEEALAWLSDPTPEAPSA